MYIVEFGWSWEWLNSVLPGFIYIRHYVIFLCTGSATQETNSAKLAGRHDIHQRAGLRNPLWLRQLPSNNYTVILCVRTARLVTRDSLNTRWPSALMWRHFRKGFYLFLFYLSQPAQGYKISLKSCNVYYFFFWFGSLKNCLDENASILI